MKNVITETRGSFTGMGIMAIIAGMALCLSLNACTKAEEASLEAPVVEMMDQPEGTADAPAAGEELSAADDAGDADTAAPETRATAGEAPAAQPSADEAPVAQPPAAETPTDEAPAAQAPAAETPAASGN